MQHVRTERSSNGFTVTSVLTAAFLLAIGFTFQNVFSQSSIESPNERDARVTQASWLHTYRKSKSFEIILQSVIVDDRLFIDNDERK